MGKKGQQNSTQSMTGFGAARAEDSKVSVEVEIKSSNSRYLDLSFRLPKIYNQFETGLRELAAPLVSRGRVEIIVNRIALHEGENEVHFHKDAFQALWKIYSKVGKDCGLADADATLGFFRDIMQRREVLEISEEIPNVSAEEKLVLGATKKALNAMSDMRKSEGARLADDISARIGRLGTIKETIAEKMRGKPQQARDRLLEAVRSLASDVKLDESRLCAEVALLVDRADISEELVRLDSHFKHFSEALGSNPAGKKLDFIIQELVREVNTIGSKAQDADVQSLVVEAKTEIERVREQVQNIE